MYVLLAVSTRQAMNELRDRIKVLSPYLGFKLRRNVSLACQLCSNLRVEDPSQGFNFKFANVTSGLELRDDLYGMSSSCTRQELKAGPQLICCAVGAGCSYCGRLEIPCPIMVISMRSSLIMMIRLLIWSLPHCQLSYHVHVLH